jgi:hypothetical protein
VGSAEDRDAAAADGLVDGPAVRDRRIETAGELDRGGVADGELHRRDGADSLMYQRRRSALNLFYAGTEWWIGLPH